MGYVEYPRFRAVRCALYGMARTYLLSYAASTSGSTLMSDQGQRQNLSIVTDAYRLLIWQMREAVFVFNGRGDVLDANPAAEALLSQSAADFIGQPAESVFAALPDLQTYLSGGDMRGELISNSEDASYYYDF